MRARRVGLQKLSDLTPKSIANEILTMRSKTLILVTRLPCMHFIICLIYKQGILSPG